MLVQCCSIKGQTWGIVTWPVPPTPTGPGYEMARGGNPTVIFDSKRQNVVLHFNRGMSDPDGDGNFDCIPAVDNFQIISGDFFPQNFSFLTNQ